MSVKDQDSLLDKIAFSLAETSEVKYGRIIEKKAEDDQPVEQADEKVPFIKRHPTMSALGALTAGMGASMATSEAVAKAVQKRMNGAVMIPAMAGGTAGVAAGIPTAAAALLAAKHIKVEPEEKQASDDDRNFLQKHPAVATLGAGVAGAMAGSSLGKMFRKGITQEERAAAKAAPRPEGAPAADFTVHTPEGKYDLDNHEYDVKINGKDYKHVLETEVKETKGLFGRKKQTKERSDYFVPYKDRSNVGGIAGAFGGSMLVGNAVNKANAASNERQASVVHQYLITQGFDDYLPEKLAELSDNQKHLLAGGAAVGAGVAGALGGGALAAKAYENKAVRKTMEEYGLDAETAADFMALDSKHLEGKSIAKAKGTVAGGAGAALGGGGLASAATKGDKKASLEDAIADLIEDECGPIGEKLASVKSNILSGLGGAAVGAGVTGAVMHHKGKKDKEKAYTEGIGEGAGEMQDLLQMEYQEAKNKGLGEDWLAAEYRNKQASKLTQEERDALDEDEFVFPDQRRYPIYDKSHARAALRFSKGKSEERKVRDAVYNRYPEMRKSATFEEFCLDITAEVNPEDYTLDK